MPPMSPDDRPVINSPVQLHGGRDSKHLALFLLIFNGVVSKRGDLITSFVGSDTAATAPCLT